MAGYLESGVKLRLEILLLGLNVIGDEGCYALANVSTQLHGCSQKGHNLHHKNLLTLIGFGHVLVTSRNSNVIMQL